MAHSHVFSAFKAKAIGFILLFLGIVPMVVYAALSTQPIIQSDGSTPSPELKPSEVVRIQVDALRTNSPSNKGIELTYRFASPGNKRSTGPLDRFTEMVRSAPYDRLLNHLSARYGPVAVSDNEAYQIVIITDKEGEEVAYIWVLSRQSEGEFRDCWMTDAVIPAQRPVQRKVTQRSVPLEAAFASSKDFEITPHTG